MLIYYLEQFKNNLRIDFFYLLMDSFMSQLNYKPSRYSHNADLSAAFTVTKLFYCDRTLFDGLLLPITHS